MQQSEIIKQQGSITQLVKMLGYSVTQKKINSIYKEEKTASLTIYEATNSYYCFATGKGGDLFNFYADVKGLSIDSDFSTIVREVGELLGIIDYSDEANKTTKLINIDVSLDQVTVKKEEPKINPALVKEISKAIYQDLILSSIHFDYLTSQRGLKPELTKTSGFKTLANLDVKKLIEDFDPLILEQMGILYQQKTLNSYLVDSLVIPFFDSNNELITLQFRLTNPNVKTRYKFYGATHTPEAYNLDQILNQIEKGTIKEGENIFLTEGVIDTLTLLQSGNNAFAIMSASLSDKITDDKIKQLIQSKANIIFAFDNDEAGQKLEEKIKARFEKLGAKRLSKVVLPDKIKDINQYFVEEHNLGFEIKEVYALAMPKIRGLANLDSILNAPLPCYLPVSFLPGVFQTRALSTIVACTNHGKTAMLLNIAEDLLRQGKRVCFVTLEEEAQEIYFKLASIYCNDYIDQNIGNQSDFLKKVVKYQNQEVTYNQNLMEHYKEFENYLTSSKLAILDVPMIKIGELYQELQNLLNFEPYDVILIDYIQKLEPDKQGGNRQLELQSITKRLPILARELNTAVVVGCQFNRETQDPKQMKVAGIREAGDIAQDSQTVLGLWNYNHTTDNDKPKNEILVTMMKNRGVYIKDVTLTVKSGLKWVKQDNERLINKINSNY
jgi:replicative DNA helicase